MSFHDLAILGCCGHNENACREICNHCQLCNQFVTVSIVEEMCVIPLCLFCLLDLHTNKNE